MARFGQVNIGQLARQDPGKENVFAIGFGTATGTVFCGLCTPVIKGGMGGKAGKQEGFVVLNLIFWRKKG